VSVTFRQDDPVGLVAIVGGLLQRNLERDPARRRRLREETSVLDAPDAAVSVTIRCSPSGVVVSAGADPEAIVVVRAESRLLLELASVPLRFGLPDPLTSDGRGVLAQIARGSVRIRGLVSHLPAVRRLTMLLSVR
jgi:hypothetical protein